MGQVQVVSSSTSCGLCFDPLFCPTGTHLFNRTLAYRMLWRMTWFTFVEYTSDQYDVYLHQRENIGRINKTHLPLVHPVRDTKILFLSPRPRLDFAKDVVKETNISLWTKQAQCERVGFLYLRPRLDFDKDVVRENNISLWTEQAQCERVEFLFPRPRLDFAKDVVKENNSSLWTKQAQCSRVYFQLSI